MSASSPGATTREDVRGPAGQPGETIQQAGESRLARIESLRAIAAVGVVIGHSWGRAHDYGPSAQDGFVERVVFHSAFGAFLLLGMSGYLLYWPFVRHHFGGGSRMDLRQYALNRALRILPLYFIAMTFLLLVQERGGTFDQWWKFMTFFANFYRDTVATVDGPLWSVIIELHYYLVLPPLAWAIAKVSRGRLGYGAIALGVLTALSAALWIKHITLADRPDPLWRYNLPATFFFIGSGMLLAMARLAVERDRPAWLEGRAGSADLWLLASLPLWLVMMYDTDWLPLVTVGTLLVVGAAVLPLRPGPVLRALDWRPLAVVGVASYSLYVWHNPIVEWLGHSERFPDGVLPMMLVLPPLCIGVALVSYRVIEQPFLQLRRRWSPASAPNRPSS